MEEAHMVLVLREDIYLKVVASLSTKMLIGKFMYCSISKYEFDLWIKQKIDVSQDMC